MRVIFVDDDDTFRRVLVKELGAMGCEVRAFPSAEGVVAALGEFEPEVVLLDLKLPGTSGMRLLEEIRAAAPDVQVIVLTGHGAVPEAVQAMRTGAYDFLTKPVSLDVLEQAVARAAEKNVLVTENRRLRRLAAPDDDACERLARAPSTAALRPQIERIARSGGNVLIQGENGTGKELIARCLHAWSPRHDRPFVVVNCGAIPETLVESELFGHERGSFTGADKRRVGLFEAAHGGTLFLDEVGEMPLSVQPTLLRSLQFGEIRPVGGDRTRRVDVRVVAATNRDLLVEIEQARFRQDLYYRLAALLIDVPPLRARPQDIEPLARDMLERECVKSGQAMHLTDGAVRRLAAHDWPGNVRELENIVMRLCLLASSETIAEEDVERQLVRRTARSTHDALPTLDLDTLERIAVLDAMKCHDNDKKAAAAELGVSLKTLYNKLARYRAV